MLAHSIDQARGSRLVTRVLVSTDSALYAAIAAQYGAETPFLRPPEISGDLSTDLEVFQHALFWLRTQENYLPEICVHLRATFPTRRTADIDRAIEMLLADVHCDSVRSVVRAPLTPWKMWFMDQEGLLRPVVASQLHDPFNLPRQALPEAYFQNACIDVVRARVILEQHSMSGRRIRSLLMEELNDIDEYPDLSAARLAGDMLLVNRTFAFDIEGVIATLAPGDKYELAAPIQAGIDVVNRLHAAGSIILLLTTRANAAEETTRAQLRSWGVKFHHIVFGRPEADYYVGERVLTLHDLQQLCQRLD